VEQLEFEARCTWDEDEEGTLEKVLNLFSKYEQQYCGTRDESGDDFGQGKIANVKNMEWHSDPTKRSTGSIETKNRWYNRMIRGNTKGGLITERQFLTGHKKAERLVHLQVATFDKEIAEKKQPKRSRLTKDLVQLCEERFPVVTHENLNEYFMTLKMLLSGQMP